MNKEEIIHDYRIACQSREASILARKEVFMGRAKFGIFGDGKEVPQLAMAKIFKNGDFRSGYYRDQTFMFATQMSDPEKYFAQLYAHADISADPASAGRMMNAHFATRMIDEEGNWKNLVNQKNSVADISPVGSQMSRLVGLAYASKLFRNNEQLHKLTGLSNHGNEIAFGTIGDSAIAEGVFFEAINAAGVLQIPMLVSIWDDGYGISVPQKLQIAKENIFELLAGFKKSETTEGYEIFQVKGWDYVNLCETYFKAEKLCRQMHIPVIIHVTELTQPQGHSTSGSHTRYKSKSRLTWEEEYDCIKKMREWIIMNNIATDSELKDIEDEAAQYIKHHRDAAWSAFRAYVDKPKNKALHILKELNQLHTHPELDKIIKELEACSDSTILHAVKAMKRALYLLQHAPQIDKNPLLAYLNNELTNNETRFSSHLYDESYRSALKVASIPPVIQEGSEWIDGKDIVKYNFDKILENDPRVFIIGEDVGKIGDVNQGLAGLQEKYGDLRVTDTGIRENTIVGQGIGAAIRGLKPIVEIQYLDYLLCGLQIMSDDLATLQYRTAGGQKAPLIIRTRGHRLEGIWHSGSYISGMLNNIRGIYLLVPRNMTQAAGFYNTMLKSHDAALIVECLNGYRLKEQLPLNIGYYTVPLGIPEILRVGKDITIVTYGSMCRVIMEAAEELEKLNISCEVIDVQTLSPFDINGVIIDSLKKTNKIIFADEDVPGGATAYMMQKVLEEQNGYDFLDHKPITVTSKDHRPAYADDGNYFSKPNVEDILDAAYKIMQNCKPRQF
jgi:2-oxoisovalerate dehydrogenase E1 component